MLQVIIDNRYFLAGWMEEGRVFYYAWKGFAPPQEMKSLLEQVLTHLQKSKCSLMLQDLRHAQAVGMEMQEWIISYWLPRAVEVGIQKIAILAPVSIFAKIAIEQIKGKSPVSNVVLESQIFEQEESALQWLYTNQLVTTK
ncbi:MAG: hypothetical protein RMJ87_11435 [Cytophagales bacterium]|nr:hypothetical protein [Bernardetiaceae bacterium]MDW8205632.1 hypothetical protein [Cytophagales bacterium]